MPLGARDRLVLGAWGWRGGSRHVLTKLCVTYVHGESMCCDGRKLSTLTRASGLFKGSGLDGEGRSDLKLKLRTWNPLTLCSVIRYVLLHHVMGGLEGMQGAWGYVQGGMGALSDAIASSATAYGASIFTEKVRASLLNSDH